MDPGTVPEMTGERIGAIAFGPIPSRRLGQSLGVNTIAQKTCSYDCVYCQIGRTPRTQFMRRDFSDPADVVTAVAKRLTACTAAGQAVDYISFVPDGEPSLDGHLGQAIRGVKALGVPVAVITNGSLLWMADVRDEISAADLVSIEVDAADAPVWRRINRPYRAFDFDTVRHGMLDFASAYHGRLLTQTMLVNGLNDDEASVERIAAFVAEINPAKAYLAIPTRPPADAHITPPPHETLLRAYVLFAERVPSTELLAGYGEGTFGAGGGIADLFAMLAVHPMRRDAAAQYLADSGAPGNALDELVRSGELAISEYRGEVFVIRRIG